MTKKQGSIKLRRRIGSIFGHSFLAVMGTIWLLPIVWLIMQSFRGEGGATTNYIIPKIWTLDNYIKLFTETGLFNFPRWFMNTLFVAIISCILSTIIILLTSYAFSRLRFKLRVPMMNVVLILGMFPGFMSMTAVYHIIKAMGLAQSLYALILVYSGGAAMSYYISKGFFDTIPYAIDEAAMIADQNPPVLSTRNRSGEVEYKIHKHPAYVKLEKAAYETYGLAAMSHRAGVLGWSAPSLCKVIVQRPC